MAKFLRRLSAEAESSVIDGREDQVLDELTTSTGSNSSWLSDTFQAIRDPVLIGFLSLLVSLLILVSREPVSKLDASRNRATQGAPKTAQNAALGVPKRH